MQYLEPIASILTMVGIYLFSEKNKHAPDIYILSCIIWIFYSVVKSMPWFLVMNVILMAINLKNYKSYKRGKHE